MTNYCEWPDIPEFARPHFPIVPLAMLEKSVDNLAALAGSAGPRLPTDPPRNIFLRRPRQESNLRPLD